MFQQRFVNRRRELQFLEEAYGKNTAQLLLLYGRRRIGKTELVKQFAKNKPHLYFLADERGDIFNIQELKKIMAVYLNDPLFEKAAIQDWVELFHEFAQRMPRKTLIAIDEFPYLIKENKAIPSLFQKIWDLYLSKTDCMLILLGSSISVMETEVLGYHSPLYGRRTGQWKVEPLQFKELHAFFPYSMEEQIACYAILDGIPLYLLQFNPEKDVIENMLTTVLRKGEFLYQEAEILLRQEVREPSHYFAILKAISFGMHSFGDIVHFSQLDKTIVSKYVENLQRIHIIEKEFPVTQHRETRNARYIFTDNYFHFWFHFVYPNKSLIEEDKQDILWKKIKEDFHLYVSTKFERLCRTSLYAVGEKLHFVPEKAGRWWHKEKEIDVVALNEQNNAILFAECKWQEHVSAQKVLHELREKAAFVDWNNNKRTEYYVIFAKSFKEKSKESNVLLIDLIEMEKIMK